MQGSIVGVLEVATVSIDFEVDPSISGGVAVNDVSRVFLVADGTLYVALASIVNGGCDVHCHRYVSGKMTFAGKRHAWGKWLERRRADNGEDLKPLGWKQDRKAGLRKINEGLRSVVDREGPAITPGLKDRESRSSAKQA